VEVVRRDEDGRMEESLEVVDVELRRRSGRADVTLGALRMRDMRGEERDREVVRGVRKDVKRGMSRGILGK
jgi:hypothetical protein